MNAGLFSTSDALAWCEKLIALAMLLQTIEFFLIRNSYDDSGVWRWQTLKREFAIFPGWAQGLFNAFLRYECFLVLLTLRLVLSLLLLAAPHGMLRPEFIFILLMSSILIGLRWRGVFNGGSDYMTVVVLMSLWIAETFADRVGVVEGAIWYIGLQSCASYFIAGVAKLKNERWRRGEALARYLRSPAYNAPALVQDFFTGTKAFAAAWIIMLFECLFPLSLLSPKLSAVFICAALLFHLVNIYVFGLNRFLFAWAATYPALYWCSIFSRPGS